MTTIDLNGTSIEVESAVTVVRVGADERERLIRGRNDVVGPIGATAAVASQPPPEREPELEPERAAGEDPGVSAARARVDAAQAGSAAAQQALAAAREADRGRQADDQSRREVAATVVERLERERAELEAKRIEIMGRIAEVGEVPDPKPVRDALDGLHRLREVKPKPSRRAAEIAERWSDVRRRLAALPQPPAPPEWLVTPALAALHEARDALAEAERATNPGTADQSKVDAVERAHREVLDAEQRVMAKASRGNRKRLDQAMAAEQAALTAIGAASYGEYLQRLGPSGDGASGGDRVAAARAALADAEAVWEELHGGQAPPDYTAAKEEEAAIRAEALALLGAEVPDDQLERRLREHLETVVDSGWAEHALADALASVGAGVEGDVEQWAASWLEAIPGQQRRRAEIDAELAQVDDRLAAIDAELGEQRGNAFFGDDPEAAPGGRPAEEVLAGLEAALAEAQAAERDATAALEDARRRAEEKRAASASPAASASTEPRQPAFEADVWFVARVASVMASTARGPALIVDARAAVSSRARRALEKAAARLPVVVVGDDEDVVAWAEGLGDRATVRSI